VAAPVWAAFAALLNQAQGTKLGFLNPLLYPFADGTGFHDAASMGSDFAHVGLGSPNLNQLHQLLSGQTVGAPSASISEVETFYGTPSNPALPGFV
jgi:subtilase family serine protease